MAAGCAALLSSTTFEDRPPDTTPSEEYQRSLEQREIAIRRYTAAAQNGDAEAQYRLALLSVSESDKSKWFCLAANKRHAAAMFHLGGEALRSVGFKPNNKIQAYKWYTLAYEHGNEFGKAMSERIAKEMTVSEIVEAESAASNWEPNPSECQKYERISPNS